MINLPNLTKRWGLSLLGMLLISFSFFYWFSQRTRVAHTSRFPEKLAFYYGFPSEVNDSSGDINKATTVFEDYDILVFGNTLDSPLNQDHALSRIIINNLQPNGTRIYGYVDLCFDGGNYCSSLPLSEIYASTDRWADMGAVGIFFDQVGFEYSVSRDRLNAAVDYAHNQGLSVFVNAWDPDDVFSPVIHPAMNPLGTPTHLGPNDYFLHESFAVLLSGFQDSAFLIEKSEKALKWKKIYGTKMATVNTVAFSVPPFDQEKLEYVWWMTMLYGFDAMAWGETGIYSADCQCLPYHSRPDPGDIGSAIDPITVSHNGAVHWRNTKTGTIKIDTSTHVGQFIPGTPPPPSIVKNFVTQSSSQSGDLVYGNAVFLLSPGQINLIIQSNGARIDSYRIFIDKDVNANTGFIYSRNNNVGADYLVENGKIYEFTGTNQTSSSWSSVGTATVNGLGNAQIQVAIPFDQIDYVTGTNLAVLVEHNNPTSQDSYDLLPRSPDIWVIQSSSIRPDNQINQRGSNKNTDLISANVRFGSEQITIEIQSNEAPIDSYRIFLDKDINATTGFIHSGNPNVGADYLVEDGKIYEFTGSTQTSSSWSLVGKASVDGLSTTQVKVAIVFSQIGYLAGKNLIILVEHLDATSQDTYDLLPRFPGVWVIEFISNELIVFSSNEVSQTGTKSTNLISGSVTFHSDHITFTIKSKDAPIDSYRIFLDMDADKGTGFLHFRNANGGSEYLIENGQLYKFTGTSQTQWSWPLQGPVTDTGVGTTQVKVNVPFSQIGYAAGEKLGILMESMDPKWITYDLVPRFPGVWRVK